MRARPFLLIMLALLLAPLAAHALATAVLYQGRLVQAGAAPTGSYDFTFALYDSATGGTQVGDTVTLHGVAVANGLFTAPLDFGAAPFTGADRWLQVGVRTVGSTSYTPLTPRQPLAPTPYALFAKAVNWDDILNRPAAFGIYTAGTGLWLTGQQFAIADGGVTAVKLASDTAGLAKTSGGIMTARTNGIAIGPNCPMGELFQVYGYSYTAMGIEQTSVASSLRTNGVPWQSFTATANITLKAIEVLLSPDAPDTDAQLVIYAGEGTGGAVLRSQAIALDAGYGYRLFTLATPVALTAGSLYTFAFTGIDPWISIYDCGGNVYAGGREWATASYDLYFRLFSAKGATGTPALLIDEATLNVGIGTGTPAAKLDVNGTAKMTGFQLGSTATAGQVLTADANGNGSWAALPASLPPSGTAGGDLTGSYPNPTVGTGKIDSSRILDGTIVAADLAASAVISTRLAPDAASLARVTNSAMVMNGANVGIGTVTAGFPLTFANTTGDKISLWGQSGDHYGFGIQAGALQIHTATSGHDILFGYGQSGALTETVRFKGNGNVGIGTGTPAAKLDVNGTAKMTGFQLGSTATAGQVLIADAAGAGTWASLPASWLQGGNAFGATGVLGTTDNNALEIKVNNTRVARLEPGDTAPNIILGHPQNYAQTGSFGGTIGGGGSSGFPNIIGAAFGTIGGGYRNVISGYLGTIGGGEGNEVDDFAGAIGGGSSNLVSLRYGTVGGGRYNTTSDQYGTVPGGYSNSAAFAAFAAGYRAKATQSGSFVWGDYQEANITAPAANTFSVRATNGIWLGNNSSPSIPAGRFLNTSTGGYLSSTGTWTNSCDRNLKTAFAAIDGGNLLKALAALPITEWRYTANAGERHIGPTAQDFRAAFGLGLDDVSISTVDGIGVALASAQALQRELAGMKAENAEIKGENAALRDEMARLRAEMAELKALVRKP